MFDNFNFEAPRHEIEIEGDNEDEQYLEVDSSNYFELYQPDNWYHGVVDRKEAEDRLLRRREPCSYLVRERAREADGKSDYVQCRELLPVDDRTPEIGRFSFTNIKAENCHVAASFLYGLPEKKIKQIEFKNVELSFAKEAKEGTPAMLSGVGECKKKGFMIHNVETLICENVTVSGAEGEAFELNNIDHYEIK